MGRSDYRMSIRSSSRLVLPALVARIKGSLILGILFEFDKLRCIAKCEIVRKYPRWKVTQYRDTYTLHIVQRDDAVVSTEADEGDGSNAAYLALIPGRRERRLCKRISRLFPAHEFYVVFRPPVLYPNDPHIVRMFKSR